MHDYKITNTRIPGYEGLQELAIRERKIVAIAPSVAMTDLPSLDVGGDWISLGGWDLQINGALGLAFPDVRMSDFGRLTEICDFLWEQGVDGFLPTIVTTSIENINRSLAVFAKFIAQQPDNTAKVLGVHLEGPFLNPQKRGAHPQEYLLDLTLDFVAKVLSKYAEVVKVITLAPELDPTGMVIPYLRSLDIIVSLGHSQANFDQAERAFGSGASMVTHAFNAMPGLHHREPGLLGSALTQSHVRCGFIADGQHVHPAMLKLLVRAGNYTQGLFLVSDALSPLGLPDGKYPWDVREIEVIDGTARLADGTLSGTTRALFVGAQNLVKWGICDPGTALFLATIAPRQALSQKKGVSSLPFQGESSKNSSESQAPSFHGGANPKSKIQNPKSSDNYLGQTANLLRWKNDLTDFVRVRSI
jgi:N-acetylglucosamine-6-phosphate deacetylase